MTSSHHLVGDWHQDNETNVVIEDESASSKRSVVKTTLWVWAKVAWLLKYMPTMFPAVTYAGLVAPYAAPDTTQDVLMIAWLLAEIFKSYKAVDNTTLQRVTGWTLEACNTLFAFWLTINNFESTAMKFALAAAIINLVVRWATREEILKRDIWHS